MYGEESGICLVKQHQRKLWLLCFVHCQLGNQALKYVSVSSSSLALASDTSDAIPESNIL
jgi:hypothetical protein